MKQYYLYVTPDGSINLIEGEKMAVMPERDYRHGTSTEYVFKIEYEVYEAALKTAKASSVPVQDQDKTKNIIAKEIIEGAIYGPFSGEYEIQEFHYCKQCGAYKSIKRIPCQNAYCGKTTEKVAILLPEKKQKIKCTCPCHTSDTVTMHFYPCCDEYGFELNRKLEELDKKKEESQEDMLLEIIMNYRDNLHNRKHEISAESDDMFIKAELEKFTIIRKP